MLADNGELLDCGSGEDGRNCNGALSDVLSLELVDLLARHSVVQAYASSAFEVALVEDSAVCTWARNNQGQLGLGLNLAIDASLKKKRCASWR